MLAVGGYRGDLGVSPFQIGGVEDLEILERLWDSGRKALYNPEIYFQHKVSASRLTKSYHRRWHSGHGYFYAVLRDKQVEQSAATFLGVPAHLYRQAMKDVLGWAMCMLTFRPDEAFSHTARLCFFRGFFKKRRSDYQHSASHGFVKELVNCARALLARGA